MFRKLIQKRKLRKQLKELLNSAAYRLDCDDDILDEKTKTELRCIQSELKQYSSRCNLADLEAVSVCGTRLERLLGRLQEHRAEPLREATSTDIAAVRL